LLSSFSDSSYLITQLSCEEEHPACNKPVPLSSKGSFPEQVEEKAKWNG